MAETPVHELDPARTAYVRALAPYLAALDALAEQTVIVETFRRFGSPAPRPVVGAVGREVGHLSNVIREAQATADMAGRRSALEAARSFSGGTLPPAPPGPVTPPAGVPGGSGGPLPRVPFTEAVADVVAREPRLAGGAREVAAAYNQDHGFAMARAVEAETVKRAQKAVAKAIQTGATVEQSTAELLKIARRAGEDMGDWTRAYAETVFRTNVATAYSAGRFRQMADPAVAFAIGGLRYTTAGDTDVRPNHRKADGLIAGPTDPVWQSLAPPLGFNSFVPGTRVEGRVDAASEARYSGPLVEIKTRERGGLTVTPNHPVLVAGRGFVPAGEVRKGDHLVCHLPARERLIRSPRDRSLSAVSVLRRAVHDQEVVPRIEDVFGAARAHGARPSVEGTAGARPLDFHGDAGFYEGHVHVVSLDRLLPDDRIVAQTAPEFLDERVLVKRPESPGDFAHAASLALSGRGGPCLLGSTPEIDPARSESVVDDGTRGAYVLGELQDAFASEVAFHEVIDVDVHSYSGHVYDLQSPFGWIVANGYAVSNCRCGLDFISWPELKRRGLVVNGRVRDARAPSGAHADAGFTHTGRPDVLIYGGS